MFIPPKFEIIAINAKNIATIKKSETGQVVTNMQLIPIKGDYPIKVGTIVTIAVKGVEKHLVTRVKVSNMIPLNTKLLWSLIN